MEVEKQLHLQMRLLGLLLVVLIVIACVQSSPVSSYVTAIKEASSLPDSVSDEERKLKEKIKKEASKKNQKPINARVDRIWKAIPGYNGRMVDEEKTLQKTLAQRDRKNIHWVYHEVKPSVDLKDLGAVPIYRGNPNKPAAALMVNVAWGTEHLPVMLNILRRENVKATFFLDGSWLKKHPKEARLIQKEGHEIGNHAYSHPLMSQLSTARMDQEMSKTETLMQQHLHKKSRYFAPPAGDYNQKVIEQAWQHQMHTILWTVDTVDWRKSSTPDMMISKVRTQLENGSLLLTHPTDRTVKALPEMIRIGKRKGIKWGRVSEVLSPKRLDQIE